MITDNQVRQLLRGAALSASLLLMAAPAALADPQGYRAYTAGYALSDTAGGQMPGVGTDRAVRANDPPPAPNVPTICARHCGTTTILAPDKGELAHGTTDRIEVTKLWKHLFYRLLREAEL
jgi:hypothetical protein